MTRLTERFVEATVVRVGEAWILRSPSPGLFLPSVVGGDRIVRGHVLGQLEVLGRRVTLTAPDVAGLVATAGAMHGAPDLLAPRTVGYADALLVLDITTHLGAAAAAETATETTATGLVFRAPTSGRFYSRSTPGKPPFVSVGDELGPGATVCLLEVMKTFNRVTYGGPGLPERARVTAVLVADGADVTAGDPLLQLA